METEVSMNQSVDSTCIARDEANSELLSAQQRRFWVLDQHERTDAPHNVSAGWEIRGALDHAALEKAVQAVIGRHDVLRSRFVFENDDPRTVLDGSPFCALPVVSLVALPPEERMQAAADLAANDLRQAFGLRAGPLFRATLYEMGDSEHLLALAFHKIVCDSVSSRILEQRDCSFVRLHRQKRSSSATSTSIR